MKYRVERERTDAGLGPTWVVLDDQGSYVAESHHWRVALELARRAVTDRAVWCPACRRWYPFNSTHERFAR